MYQRILSRRPFIVIDSDSNNYDLVNDRAQHFIYLMREAKILVRIDKLLSKIDLCMQLAPRLAKLNFEDRAFKLLNHVLQQPRLDELIQIK